MGWRTEGARERSREHVWPQGLPVWEAVGPTAKGTLCSRVGHAPPTGRWRGMLWFTQKISLSLPFKPISFPPHLVEFWRTLEKISAEFYNFRFLVLIISLSYELEINRFKNQSWSRRELQTLSISRGSWLHHFSQLMLFQYVVSMCISTSSFSISSLIISWFLLFDWWNLLRSMLDHLLGLFDHLLIEF